MRATTGGTMGGQDAGTLPIGGHEPGTAGDGDGVGAVGGGEAGGMPGGACGGHVRPHIGAASKGVPSGKNSCFFRTPRRFRLSIGGIGMSASAA